MTPAGIEPATFRFVAQHLNHCAIAVPNNNNNNNLEGKVTILWSQRVQIDSTIPSNKPDIIIRDNKQGTCMLQFLETEV